MIIPPFLQPGDTVGIAATARKISREELAYCMETMAAWGLKVKLSPTLFDARNQFAGTDEQRAEGLSALLKDREVKAILCARGGYGTVRIVDMIDWNIVQQNPKWIIGYSDITVLQAHLLQNFGIATIHGTMAFNINEEKERQEAITSLKKVLFGEPVEYALPAHPLNKTGNAGGIITGGNLSVLYSLLGSVSFPDTAGKILFLEDLDEYLYHIDRMMMALKRAGVLKNLAGLVIGGMTEMKDNAIPFGKTAEEIIYEAVREYNYPLYFGLEAGHVKNNLAFPMAVMAELNNNKLVFKK